MSALLHRGLLKRYGQYKAIAHSRDGDDCFTIVVFINQDLADGCKVHPQVAFAHICVLPDSRRENLTRYRLSCVFN